MEKAEHEVFRLVQRDGFPDLRTNLSSQEGDAEELVIVTNGAKSLPVTMQSRERLIRLTTRDRTSSRAYALKSPILLPKNHEFVHLFLRHRSPGESLDRQHSPSSDVSQRRQTSGVRFFRLKS